MEKSPSKTNSVFTVAEPTTLMEFLLSSQPHKSRNKVKSQLAHRQVCVNKMIVTRFDTPLSPGDTVTLSTGKGPEAFRHPMIRIVFEDDYLIVADKRNGLLTVGTDKERTRTAFYLMSEHVKRSDEANRIFVIHRLDRETSGLLIFAKSEQVQSLMQRGWKKSVLSRKYAAVAEGELPQDEGTIEAALSQNKNFKVYIDPEGEPAVTQYRVLRRRNDYSLVELSLETGKKNQIRAHLEHIGNPIAGDKKYGAKSNPAGRVCLHAYVLDFIHPITGEEMRFSTAIPQLFDNVLDNKALPTQRPTRTEPPWLRNKSGRRIAAPRNGAGAAQTNRKKHK